MNQLIQSKCNACRKGEPTVTAEEMDEFRPQVPDWNIIEVDGVKRLEKVFKFDTFVHALAFTNKIGQLAEEEGHHPALLTEWGKVTVSWWTLAAVKAEVHEQTLRHYERLGLISPARKGNSPHSPRLYSDHDIERVMHIRGLMRDLGVNLAGVEAILHMKDRMEQMQLELEQEMARIQDQHVAETRRLKDIIERLQRGSSS